MMNINMAWFLSATFAGGVAATMSLPFDNAKTKLQKMKAGPDGKMPYKNIFDAMAKTLAQSGPAGLFVGLPTYILRIAPHVMITMIVSEWFKKLLL
jgi:solute carrier family 25 oxoglutarate transporter 11